ncbi:hypothetical protein WKW77_21490 [Variovorax ureilyticus]|uniref:Uncharacterized protein n=1 Tax=Variovorax ureilyticus TaxID=1836198 RepID=A0ABU8VJ40_9BURK
MKTDASIPSDFGSTGRLPASARENGACDFVGGQSVPARKCACNALRADSGRDGTAADGAREMRDALLLNSQPSPIRNLSRLLGPASVVSEEAFMRARLSEGAQNEFGEVRWKYR